MAGNTEGAMVPVEILTTVFNALEDTKKTISLGIDRLTNKVDEMSGRMVTHRDLDEIKARLSRNEAASDRLATEVAKRAEVDTQVSTLQSKLDSQASRINDLERNQGRAPQWFWPSTIAVLVAMGGWYFNTHH